MKNDSSLISHTSYLKRFTLIELLIVIAIISILAGMLLPALGNVRKTSQATTCLNLFREFGKGSMLYCNDNDQWILPYRNDGITDGSHCKFAFGQPPSRWLLAPYVKTSTTKSIGKLTRTQTVRPDIDCPARQFDPSVGGDTEHIFGVNYTLSASSPSGAPKISKCMQPSGTSIIAECQCKSYGQYGADTEPPRKLWFVQHQGRACVTFLDAHAILLKEADQPGLDSFPFYRAQPKPK